MKRIALLITGLAISLSISMAQPIPAGKYVSRFISIIERISPEDVRTWKRVYDLYGLPQEADVSQLLGVENRDSLDIVFDTLEVVIGNGPSEELDALKAVLKEVTVRAEKLVLAKVPSFQGIAIEGDLDELAKRFEKRGWKDLWLEEFTEAELREAGYSLKDLHKRQGGIIVMKGYFRRKEAKLVLWPISPENNNVSYIGLSMIYSESNLHRFVDYDFMPLVEEYSNKYGECSILSQSERFKHSESYTSSYSIGPNQQLISYSFEIPSVTIRAQTNEDSKFQIIVHYTNIESMALQAEVERGIDDI